MGWDTSNCLRRSLCSSTVFQSGLLTGSFMMYFCCCTDIHALLVTQETPVIVAWYRYTFDVDSGAEDSNR